MNEMLSGLVINSNRAVRLNANQAVELYQTLLGNTQIEMDSYKTKPTILHAAGYIKPEHFRNIIKVGLESRQLDWAKRIIKNYTTKITPEYQKNIQQFHLASVGDARATNMNRFSLQCNSY